MADAVDARLALRPHQVDAVTAVRPDAVRQSVIMACGTGKTLTGQYAVAKLLGGGPGAVLVLVPTLMLLEQTYLSWVANAPFAFEAIAVCSKLTRQEQTQVGAEGDIAPADLSLAATTDPAVLTEFMVDAGPPGVRVVFGTYQSLGVVIAFHSEHGGGPWSVVVCDEAHRTAGEKTKPFARVLHDESVPATRRLFLTATPRVHKVSASLSASAPAPGSGPVLAPLVLASMDNEQLYGPQVYVLSVAEAIGRGILSDYRVAVIGVEDHELHDAARAMAKVIVAGHQLSFDHVAAIVALSKAAQQYGLRAIIAFFNRIAASENFVKAFNEVHRARTGGHLAEGTAEHIDGEMPLDDRVAALARLAENRDEGFHLVSNARCLSEGIDVPVLDAVFFGEPRGSQVEVVQCVGRAIRKNPRSDNPALIVLGVRIGDGEDAETAIEEQQFKKVRQVLAALSDHDPRIIDAARVWARAGTAPPGQPGGPTADDLARAKKLLSLDIPDNQLDSGFALKMLSQADQSWEKGYRELLTFVTEHGHACVPTGFTTASGHNLGKWVMRQRRDYRTGWLTASRTAELETFPGWVWSVFDQQWNIGLAELRTFVTEHGHARVTNEFTTVNLVNLGGWVRARRREYQLGLLDADRVAELEEVPGWVWSVPDEQWAAGLAELRTFVAEHRHACVPNKHVTANGVRLGAWVNTRRQEYRAGTLNAGRASELEALPGWMWDVQNAQWAAGLAELRTFVTEHGHAQVPQNFITVSGYSLGIWVSARRQEYRSGTLNADRVVALEAFAGWVWNVLDEQWNVRISELRTFIAEHGHTRVPRRFITASGHRLGAWVSSRRKDRQAGRLAPERIAELEALPGWTWGTSKRAAGSSSINTDQVDDTPCNADQAGM